MNTDNFFQSKLFKGIILGVAGLAALIFVFSLGLFVGARRADFSFRWAEAYHKNFAGPEGGFFENFKGREFIEPNGVFGQIININGQILTIKGGNDVEKIVLIGDKTIIKFQNQNLKLSDLKIEENIVVIGSPNDNGQIEAILIRVMPLLPTSCLKGAMKSGQNNFQGQDLKYDNGQI